MSQMLIAPMAKTAMRCSVRISSLTSLPLGQRSIAAALLDEALGRAVLRIDEDHVLRIAPRRIDRQEHERLRQDIRQRVHGAALEMQKLSRPELRLGRDVAHPEGAASRENVEVLVALRVVVR